MKIAIMIVLAAAAFTTHAHAAPPTASDRWMIEDIAQDTGMEPCAVRQVLGDHFAIAAQQYAMSPSARGRIQRVIRQHYDAWRAGQPADSTMSPRIRGCSHASAALPRAAGSW